MEFKQYFLVFLTVIFSVVEAVTIPDNVYINNLHRQFNIDSPVIREHVAISVRSKEDGVDTVYLSYKKELVDHMASIIVFTKSDKESILHIEEHEFDEENSIQYYKVKLNKALELDERIILNLEAAFTKLLKPYPKYISQRDDQYVLFETNVYYLSPYKITKQKTSIKTGSEIKSFSEQPSPAKKDGKDIIYGPYESVPFGKEEIVSIHYLLNENFIRFEKIDRTIEISHWGYNIAYNEDMIIHHDGSILKDNFNRVDFQRSQYFSQSPSAVKDLIFVLPPHAEDIYFVDVIGNVSTSAFHKDNTRTLLQILPRYPLFGGWKYTWSQGYNNPLGDNTKYDSKTGKYIFQAPVLLSLKDVPIDNFKLKIILPEGAKNIDVHLPFAFDSEERKITYSYLDTTGRPTIILEKKNICDDHFQYFQVSYKMPFYYPLQKPLIVSLFYFVIFLASMIWTRLDLRIVKDPNADKHDLAVAYWESLGGIASTGIKVLEKLVSANETYIQTGNEEIFKETCQNISKKVKETTESLEEVKHQLDEIEQNELSSKVKELISLYQEKYKTIDTKYKDIVMAKKMVNSIDKENTEEVEKATEKLNEKVSEFGIASNEIDKKITLVLNTQIL